MKFVKVMFPVAIVAAMVFVTVQHADAKDGIWTDDMDAALKQAKSENKQVLIDFTGSDWCGWCIKLDNEVFDKPEFVEQAPKEYVLVKLDFPQNKKLPEAIETQNKKWAANLGVQGFPTVVLLDSEGKPYAQTGYQAGGPEKYLASLKKLQDQRIERDKMIAEAEKATGEKKAELLDKALSTVPPVMMLNYYSDLIKQVIANDPDNKLGLKKKYEENLQKFEQMKAIQEVSEKLEANLSPLMAEGKTADALKKLEEMMGGYENNPIAKQFLTFIKANLQFESGDMATGMKTLDAAKAILPDSEIGQQIDQIKAQLQMMNQFKEQQAPEKPE